MRCSETPGNRLIHSQRKKNFERTPRELQHSDRAQTSTIGSGWPSYVGVLSVLAKSARTKRYVRKNTNILFRVRAVAAGVRCVKVFAVGISHRKNKKKKRAKNKRTRHVCPLSVDPGMVKKPAPENRAGARGFAGQARGPSAPGG